MVAVCVADVSVAVLVDVADVNVWDFDADVVEETVVDDCVTEVEV